MVFRRWALGSVNAIVSEHRVFVGRAHRTAGRKIIVCVYEANSKICTGNVRCIKVHRPTMITFVVIR